MQRTPDYALLEKRILFQPPDDIEKPSFKHIDHGWFVTRQRGDLFCRLLRADPGFNFQPYENHVLCWIGSNIMRPEQIWEVCFQAFQSSEIRHGVIRVSQIRPREFAHTQNHRIVAQAAVLLTTRNRICALPAPVRQAHRIFSGVLQTHCKIGSVMAKAIKNVRVPAAPGVINTLRLLPTFFVAVPEAPAT